jgi:hypothetical protein
MSGSERSRAPGIPSRPPGLAPGASRSRPPDPRSHVSANPLDPLHWHEDHDPQADRPPQPPPGRLVRRARSLALGVRVRCRGPWRGVLDRLALDGHRGARAPGRVPGGVTPANHAPARRGGAPADRQAPVGGRAGPGGSPSTDPGRERGRAGADQARRPASFAVGVQPPNCGPHRLTSSRARGPTVTAMAGWPVWVSSSCAASC